LKKNYLLGVRILTQDQKFQDSGILEAKVDSLKLVTTKFTGTLIGGAVLILLSSAYWFLISVPFIFLHTPPITAWNPLAEAFIVAAIPSGFVALLFLGMAPVRMIQMKYRQTSRDVTISDFQPGRYRHMIAVRSGGDNLILVAFGRRSKFIDAMALSGQA
jgi:hypothetical protein